MVQWRISPTPGIILRMMQDDRFSPFIRRLRLSAREIAIAVALTVVAATFLVTTLMGDKASDGSPVAAMERIPEKM